MKEKYGNYQLLKRLATGGMAEIYLAQETSNQRLVVIKRILNHLAENPNFVRMFLDEARIAARLAHRNVVQILDLGAQDRSYFIAMEYIHGEDLRKIWKQSVDENQRISVGFVVRTIVEACAGLEYAHKKHDHDGDSLGIVHRDISPQNILVSYDGQVKIVDFGIAKAADQTTETRSGVLKGKYAYMSPEQAKSGRIDHRTDIFALGVVLHELLCETRLFKRKNEVQTLNAVTKCNVPLPSDVNPRVPKSLDPIVLKALAKHRDDRYQHASEFRDALVGWLREQPEKIGASRAEMAEFMHALFGEEVNPLDRGDEGGELAPSEDRSESASEVNASDKREKPRRFKRRNQIESQSSRKRQTETDFTEEPLLDPPEQAFGSFTVRRAVMLALALLSLLPLVILGQHFLKWFSGEFQQPLLDMVWVKDAESSGPNPALAIDLNDAATDEPDVQVAAGGTLIDAGVKSSVALGVDRDARDGSTRIEGDAGVETPRDLLQAIVSAAPDSLPLDEVDQLADEHVSDAGEETGSLEVVIQPVFVWADVVCGDYDLGPTPFGPQTLPVGKYECVFLHPELGSQNRIVEIQAKRTSRIVVTF